MSDPHAAERPAIEERVPLQELIEALSRPEAFGVDGPVEVIQTHVSAVFLAGDRAYKVKKPLQFWGFIDYSTVAVRKHWCDTEIELNRRLAPDVYLGVVPIRRRPDGSIGLGDEGEIVEHAVVSRRWAEGATFLDRLRDGDLSARDVEEAADVLARFHAANTLAPAASEFASARGFGRVARQNFLATREDVPALFPATVHEGLRHRMAKRLHAAKGLIRQRVAAGRMVNGHGDVRLEHVLRRRAEIEIVDCVEFSDWIRHLDPLNDVAFLSMDLTDQGRPDLAAVLERRYIHASGEDAEAAAALLPVYRSYRAHVRAKVDAMTWHAPEVDPAVRAAKALGARRYLALAWTYARDGETGPIVVLRGPSGSGKSVLAERIAPLLGADVVRSDLVRKALAGVGVTERVDEAAKARLYAHEMSARTYDEVLSRGLALARQGRGALLDATYLRRDARAKVAAAAREIGAPFAILDVTCDDAEIRRRIRARVEADTDASDADEAVYDAQLREAEPLDEGERTHAVVHDSADPVETCLLPLLERLEDA